MRRAPIAPRCDAILDAHGVARPESVSLRAPQRDGLPREADLRPRDDRRRERSCRSYFDAIEAAGLGDVDVVIRMTGCPNNCARPPTAEIGIFGYGKNDHVVLVGGSREGTRLAHVLYARIPGEQMVQALVGPLPRDPRAQRRGGLPAGEFLHRAPTRRSCAPGSAWRTPPRRSARRQSDIAPARDRPAGIGAQQDRLSLPSPDSPLSRARGRAPRRASAVDDGRARARAGRALWPPRPRRPAILRDRRARPRARASGAAKGDVVTVSRNVFIPLTNLCRDRCAYCTFAKQPGLAATRRPTRSTRSRRSCAARVATGCIEALFCLGDKPEVAYRALSRVARRARLRAAPPSTWSRPARSAFEDGHAPAHQRRASCRADEMAALRPLERVAWA